MLVFQAFYNCYITLLKTVMSIQNFGKHFNPSLVFYTTYCLKQFDFEKDTIKRNTPFAKNPGGIGHYLVSHITKITFDVKLDGMTVHNIAFTDGCDGSTHGVAVMAEGKEADEIIKRLKGLQCNIIKSGSSCPDQLANAIEQAALIITGKSCLHCFFAGNFRTMNCANA